MNPLDREARAERYLEAMGALESLLTGTAPGTEIEAEPLSHLLSVLNDEARKVVQRHSPLERAPGLRCMNDDEDGG